MQAFGTLIQQMADRTQRLGRVAEVGSAHVVVDIQNESRDRVTVALADFYGTPTVGMDVTVWCQDGFAPVGAPAG